MRPLRLVAAFVLTALVAAIEFWGGFRAHSLALTTDAVHVCMDAFALAVALAAMLASTRPANRKKTFGYGRLEVLAALANATILLAATGLIAYQAILRFSQPHVPAGSTMAVFAALGLGINALVAGSLAADARSNVNVRAALVHVAGDALGAFAVMVGGVLIARSGAPWIDPFLALLIAAFIVAGVLHVLMEATDVLLEAAPRGIDVNHVESAMTSVPGVVAVHDLHVWSIGTGSRALSAHVLLADQRISEVTAVLRDIEARLGERFRIGHVTVQFESESCGPDDRVVCTRPGGFSDARSHAHRH